MAAAAAEAAETGARAAAGRSHPEAEMLASAAAGGGSEGRPVNLCVTNVYNSSSSEIVSLETTNTIADLKRLLQEAFPSRPAPHQQRLIFRGKQCEETQQLGHVLRGLDLSGQHNVHLIVSPSAATEQKPEGGDGVDSRATAERKPAAAAPPEQRPQPHPEPRSHPMPTSESSGRYVAAATGAAAAPPPVAAAAAAGGGGSGGGKGAATNARPERIRLSQMQLGQLQWQCQQALKENERALEEHRERFEFLAAQSRALTRQQHYQQRSAATTTAVSYPDNVAPHSLQQEQQQQQPQHPLPDDREVAVRAATRALGGNMPGPAGGGGVRDITGPPPAEHIPAAGLGENGGGGRGNLVDPANRAPDIGREARGWFKMVVQCAVVILVFGIDADPWLLALLALGGLITFLFRTGLLKEMLGSNRDGGGLWKKLCTLATVVTEGGGLLTDLRFFVSAFFLSLFPKWQPVRSPEAIAAEAAAQARAREAAEAAAAAAAALRVQAQAAAEQAALEAQAAEASAAEAAAAAAAEAARVTEPAPADRGNDNGKGEGAEPTPMATAVADTDAYTDADAQVADTLPVVDGTREGEQEDTAAEAANNEGSLQQGAPNVDVDALDLD